MDISCAIMRYGWRKKKKTYYVLMDKRHNTVGIYTTKAGAVSDMNVHVSTVNRNRSKSGTYENDEYILWSRIAIVKCIKGFALHT